MQVFHSYGMYEAVLAASRICYVRDGVFTSLEDYIENENFIQNISVATNTTQPVLSFVKT